LSTGCGSGGCPAGPGGSSSTGLAVTKIAGVGVGAAAGVTGALVSSGLIASSALTAAIPVVGAIVAPILAIIGTIFANHQKAIGLQSSVLCENVPAANAALQQIDAGLSNGTITPAQALKAYPTLLSGFTAAMKSDPSYKTGDAMWGYVQALQAVLAQRALDLQGAGATGAAGGVASLASGVPTWALVGGGLVLAYFFL